MHRPRNMEAERVEERQLDRLTDRIIKMYIRKE